MKDKKPNENLISEIKKMSNQQLEELASQLRQELIEDVSKTGGHLASNLGVVELTIAIHKVFDAPTDKIVWDVGHQSYIHKMITGRREQMSTLRQFGGISGFPKIRESVYDTYDSGHSGTSVSACLGYAKARDLSGEKYSCVAVIGDGALTGGVAFEALNTAGTMKTPIIVIVNDNEMSISKNVGGLSKYLQQLRTSDTYINLKKQLKSVVKTSTKSYLSKIRDDIKYTILPKTIFEELGFKYYGPIDGHNMEELVQVLKIAKAYDKPIVLHVLTKKGKGFAPAEENPSKFHGISKFDPLTVDSKDCPDENSYSQVFGSALCQLAKKDQRIVAITAAMAQGTGLEQMRHLDPKRVIDVGIAEQNAVSMAAGMALNGYKPVVAIYSTFLQRAYDMLLIEVCQMNLPVVFAIDRAGITGSDGETHQGAFDISFLNAMPNMTILSPRDQQSLKEMLAYAFSLNSPVAIRYPRGNAVVEFDLHGNKKNDDLSPQLVNAGKDVVLFSDGNMLDCAEKACNILNQQNIHSTLYDMRILKPLPKDFLDNLFKQYKYIVTIEDGVYTGGFGSSISQYALQSNAQGKVLNIGWPDCFIPAGSINQLRQHYGMDENSIADKIKAFLQKNND